MNHKIVENVLYMVLGIVILVILQFKVVEIPELFVILLGFVGFAVIIHGLFELLSIRKQTRINPSIPKKNGVHYCSECGTEIEEGTNFCPKCGRKLNLYR